MGPKQPAKTARNSQEREPWKRRGQRLWLSLNLSLWLHGGQVGRLEASSCLFSLMLHPPSECPLLHAEGHPVSLPGSPAGKGHICQPHQPH